MWSYIVINMAYFLIALRMTLLEGFAKVFL